MSTSIRFPVSCEGHDTVAMLGAERADGTCPVIGMFCVECDATYLADGACPDCQQVDEHHFNCQLNWI